MANKTYQGRIVQKHDSSVNWAKATNFIPLKGEIIIYDDLNKIKIGDGTTKVGNLKFSSCLPDDVEQAVYKNKSNIMTASGKITMDSSYTPSANGDVVTKKYVDDSAIGLFSSTKNGIVPKSDGSTTKYLRADGSWSTIDKTPVIGTTTDYAIYIGSTQPASGTTPLLWVDTTSSTGTFKYRTSTTGTWTPVPVAWI